jgi:hypothetical protein
VKRGNQKYRQEDSPHNKEDSPHNNLQTGKEISKITKKIPLAYQQIIKRFYGRQRMSGFCTKYSINSFSLLCYLKISYQVGLNLTTIKTAKVIPKWSKNSSRLIICYESIPKTYRQVIARHFSMRKARQVCYGHQLDLSLFVHLLESCFFQDISIWDLSCWRIKIFPPEVPREVFLNTKNILCPVSEFAALRLANAPNPISDQ